jgi:DNA-binding transcriptional regulator YbjK
MTRAPHPAFSPDLATSDSHLFGRLKAIMKAFSSVDNNELFRDVIEIWNNRSQQELEPIFEEWLIILD